MTHETDLDRANVRNILSLQSALAERTRERDEAIRFHTDEYHNRVALRFIMRKAPRD